MSDSHVSLSKYDLTVEVGDGKVTIRSGGGGTESGNIFLDPVRTRMIKVFDDLLRKGKISGDEELGLLGEVLYEAVFSGNVGTYFKKTLKHFEAEIAQHPELKDERLRIELSFEKDSRAQELAGYPWEFLYYPDEQTPLATKANLVLSRYMPTGRDRENIKPPEGPLKLLLVVVRPAEFRPSTGDKEAANYEKNFDAIINEILDLKKNMKTSQIEIIGPLKDPTISALAKSLDDNKPHIVHYIGHGKYSTAGEIALGGEDCESGVWCSSRTFADFFEGLQPSLVFLHLCAGAHSDKVSADYLKANFAELAPELILKHIQAVVAMRYPVHHVAAKGFTRHFYQALAEGRSVATAVQYARRWSTLSVRDSALGSPVLFMHSRDGPIFAPPPSDRQQVTTVVAPEPPASDFSFDELIQAAYAGARFVPLKENEVDDHLAPLRKELAGKSREEAQQIITRKIQNDPTSKWITVYSVMAQRLRESSG